MQRLFGTFPNRGAGLALVILRVTVAVVLMSGARLCPGPGVGAGVEVLATLAGIAAVLLMVGWYTPLAAGLAVLVSLGTLWFCHETTVNVLIIAILVSISLLGAGAYSVDARLYGRRRLVVGRPQGKAQ
jgi:uncharacterized membrane protein YphA (DoxX/SURF4 family)